jgi:hypothetical protein
MIEVVDAFISKWPTMSDCEDLPKMMFARLLLNNVIHSSHLTKSSASSLWPWQDFGDHEAAGAGGDLV